jgi:hypothetical protein
MYLKKNETLPGIRPGNLRLIAVFFVAVILLVLLPSQRVLASTDSYVQEGGVRSSVGESQDHFSSYCLHSPFVIGPGCSDDDDKTIETLLFVLRWALSHIQWHPSQLDPFGHLDFDIVANVGECLDNRQLYI